MAREGNDLWATEVQVDGIALPLHKLAAGEQLSRVIGRKMDHLCSHQCARKIKNHEVGKYQSCMVSYTGLWSDVTREGAELKCASSRHAAAPGAERHSTRSVKDGTRCAKKSYRRPRCILNVGR